MLQIQYITALQVVKGHILDSAKYKKIGKMRAHSFLPRWLIGCEIYTHPRRIFRDILFTQPLIDARALQMTEGTYRKLPFPKKDGWPARQPTGRGRLKKTDGTIGGQGPGVRTGRLGTLTVRQVLSFPGVVRPSTPKKTDDEQ